MRTVAMNSLTPGANPFTEDHYHMGTKAGDNVLVMHANHTVAKADYLIIVNVITGERVKVIMSNEHPDTIGDNAANLVNRVRGGLINSYPES